MVDAVSHRKHMGVLPQPLHVLQLLLRQQVEIYLVDPCLPLDLPGSELPVAGEEHSLFHPVLVEPAHHLLSLRTDGVIKHEAAQHPPIVHHPVGGTPSGVHMGVLRLVAQGLDPVP